MAAGLLTWADWGQHVARGCPAPPTVVSPANVQIVADLVRAEAFPTQTAIGLHMGLSSVDVTRLKALAVSGGLITEAAWKGHLRAAKAKPGAPAEAIA